MTAYALAFGSLLLLGGRLGDLIGRKITFLTGAAASFGMLVAARRPGRVRRASRPAALSILSTTFSDPKERGKAFGVYGAIVGAGGAIGLVLGGILTENLSWRWCLYVNLIFAGLACPSATSGDHDGVPSLSGKTRRSSLSLGTLGRLLRAGPVDSLARFRPLDAFE